MKQRTHKSKQKHAIVLGASVGTGAAIAEELAIHEDLAVFGMHRGRHKQEARALVSRVKAAGKSCEMTTDDAAKFENIQRAADRMLKDWGRQSVKVFVHAISGASVARLVTGEGHPPATPRQIERTFHTMAHSFVWWIQALWDRELLAPSARIVGLSNPMDDQVLRGTALIAAAKAALGSYVRHLARELGPHGHRVNIVKFGAAETHALEATMGDKKVRSFASEVASMHPNGRLVTVEEVANLVRVLVGDTGYWFNGATIDFTGGEVQGLYDALAWPKATRSIRSLSK